MNICQNPSCSILFKVKTGCYGKYCSLSCGTFHRNQISRTSKLINYSNNPSYCKECGIILPYKTKNNKFCNHSCAAVYSNLRKDYTTFKSGPAKTEKPVYSPIKFLFCNKTQQWFSNRNPDGSFRRTSPYIKSVKDSYYSLAKFKFNIYYYPEEFNLKLIDLYGWYTCPGKKRKNQPKNTNGVSRDHIISVNYGFMNNIDPRIISHPANCRIIRQSDNKKKSTKCELTLAQLLDKIKAWDKKYI